MKLPTPKFDGETSLEKAIKDRRTVRSFTPDHLTLEQLSQLTWAAQGITADRGYLRAAASAGALYPIDLYAVVGENIVEGIGAGVYHYEPKGHSITLVIEGDLRNEVARASLSQMWMSMPSTHNHSCRCTSGSQIYYLLQLPQGHHSDNTLRFPTHQLLP